MKEIDDKIDYEPGAPESLSFLKALAFMILSGLILVFGFGIGFCAGWLVSVFFVWEFGGDELTIIGTYSILSAVGGFLLAAYFLIPRLYRKWYSW